MLLALAVFVASFYWHGLGITIGYHRLLAHRSFRCPKLVEYFWVFGGYLAMQASPAWWVTVHRAHHKHADKELDPHSPKISHFHSYIGWLFRQNFDVINPEVLATDLLKDPVYRFLERGEDALQWTSNILFRVLLFYCFGWKICLLNSLGAFCAFQVPLMLNLFCHLPNLGYRRFATPDQSKNVKWVGLLAAGEGWHNNHHAFPGSARMGFTKSEVDFSWLVISAMRKLGLVNHVNDALGAPKEVFKCKQIDFYAAADH
ncbi:MAG: acyl-CoA desaturase [Candidatus Melainabacteria bacterium]|nr:MAG: acyl-CoA desaturase [Candidatus Melainabacteria bacterium]